MSNQQLLVEVKNLKVYFPIRGEGIFGRVQGYVRAVDDITLTINRGETLGVELVKNRIDFAARLGADVVIMHVYPDTVAPAYAPFNAVAWDQLRRSLDELEPYTRARGVCIAVENLIDSPALQAGVVTTTESGDNFAKIGRLFALYSPPAHLFRRDRLGTVGRPHRTVRLSQTHQHGGGDQKHRHRDGRGVPETGV